MDPGVGEGRLGYWFSEFYFFKMLLPHFEKWSLVFYWFWFIEFFFSENKKINDKVPITFYILVYYCHSLFQNPWSAPAIQALLPHLTRQEQRFYHLILVSSSLMKIQGRRLKTLSIRHPCKFIVLFIYQRLFIKNCVKLTRWKYLSVSPYHQGRFSAALLPGLKAKMHSCEGIIVIVRWK